MPSISGEDATDKIERRGGLRILHVMRAPVGGLFRHVVDLSRAQARAGHSVGIVADSRSGGAAAERILDELSPLMTLGVRRLPMKRLPHPDDLRNAWRIASLVRQLAPDIVHGHGAKGGLYARLPALLPGYPQPVAPCARVYTPHGGSLHFRTDGVVGRCFFRAERTMARVTDLIPFESSYARRRFVETIGEPPALSPVVHNGLLPHEFAPAEPVGPDAADLFFFGEMRSAKGVEDLLEAFALLPGGLRLALIGSGNEEDAFRALAMRLGVSERVAFLGPARSSREAFRRGRILVAPSRAESLPYSVLEALAAAVPIVATNVGGVPEIFGEMADALAPARNPPALAAAIRSILEMGEGMRRARAAALAASVRERFSVDVMSDCILRFYRQALVAARSRACDKVAQLRMGD